MKNNLHNLFSNDNAKRWGAFCLKAAALLLLMRLLGDVATTSPLSVGIVWAAVATISSAAIAYVAVTEKRIRRQYLQPGKLFARINAGRIVALVVAFVLAAVFSASLLLGLPRWGAMEWALVIAAIPLFGGVYALCEKTVPSQYVAELRVSSTLKFAIPITAALLCAAYFGLSYLWPADEFQTAADAFLAAQQTYANAPSSLVEETGLLLSLVNGFTDFGVSQAAQASPFWYGLAKVALSASSFLTIANILGACVLEGGELRSIFDPLGEGRPTKAPATRTKRYLATACVLPVALLGAFLYADHSAQQAMESETDTPIRQFVSDQVNLAVYVLDGKYYDEQQVNAVLADAREKAQALSANAQETLAPLINDAFDKRVANADSYLDWYYSLPADYERLANLVGGNVEQYVADQLTAKIEEGIDESAVAAQLNDYLQQAEDLQEQCNAALEECEIQGLPDWLVKTKDVLDQAMVDDSLAPANSLLSANERFAISGAAGIATGFIAKKVAEKAMQKQFFGKIVSRITNVLGARAIGGTVGAALGSPGGPALSIAGAIAGAAASIGVDYALLKVDETQNRESYKTQIVEAIEEERAETLALVQ